MDETELGRTRGSEAAMTLRSEPSRLARGDSLGRYVVLGPVGAGGMGVVYAAYDPELDRKVAIKLLHPTIAGGAESQGSQRLVREAQSLAKLQHPEVLGVHDVGVHDGRVFVAMEYVEGETVRRWLDAGPPPWRDVLKVFVAAGRGLLAAHEKGLVHRDFKPDNVMLDLDARTREVTRVRVMDFGLAREAGAASEMAATDLDRRRAGNDELTRTGAIVGTPAYIAPEQYDGQPAHAKSDQFAFCVALYEGLYGERPFTGQSQAELAAAVTTGTIRTPSRSSVPAWLRAVVVCGLASDPAARWPSMAELLAALQRDPTSRVRRRRALLVLAGIAAIAVLAAVLWERRRIAACERDSHAIAEVWNDDVRAQVEAALLATGASYAEQTAALVRQRVDAQVEEWTVQRFETCTDPARLDTKLVQVQNDCFARTRDELGDRVDLLVHADKAILNRAVGLMGADGRRKPCTDPAVLERMAAHAVPPASRERIATLSRSLAHAANLYAAGRYEAAEQLSAEIVPQAEALGDPTLAAAARARRGRVLGEMSRFPDAERELEHAFFAALAARDDDTAADAAVQLTAITGANLGRRDDGLRWGRQAEVLLALEGEREGDLAAALEHSLGLVAFTASDFPTAIAHLQRGLELRMRNHGEHSLAVARALKALGAAYARNENPDAAIEHLERALRLSEELLGPDHPMVGDASNDLGVALLDIDRSARSPAYFERAVKIYAGAGLEEKVPNSLDNLSISLSQRGELPKALEYNARALEMRERMLPPAHPAIGDALVNRAALLDQAGRPGEGIPLLRRAIELYEVTLGKEHEKISDATFNLTEQMLRTGAGTEALTTARRTLALRRKALRAGHPKIDQAILLLAMTSDAMAQPDEAITELQRALAEPSERNPMVAAQLRLALADSQLAAGDADAALATIAAVELDALHPPDRAQASFVHGKALWESGGDRDRARRLVNEALSVLREDPERAPVVALVERWLAEHR